MKPVYINFDIIVTDLNTNIVQILQEMTESEQGSLTHLLVCESIWANIVGCEEHTVQDVQVSWMDSKVSVNACLNVDLSEPESTNLNEIIDSGICAFGATLCEVPMRLVTSGTLIKASIASYTIS